MVESLLNYKMLPRPVCHCSFKTDLEGKCCCLRCTGEPLGLRGRGLPNVFKARSDREPAHLLLRKASEDHGTTTATRDLTASAQTPGPRCWGCRAPAGRRGSAQCGQLEREGSAFWARPAAPQTLCPGASWELYMQCAPNTSSPQHPSNTSMAYWAPHSLYLVCTGCCGAI